MAAPKKPRGRPKTLNRHDIVAAAAATYWREGVHGLSLNEMCRRVEVSKPGLYREFGGEDGLMVAALDHYWDRVISPVFVLLAQDRPFAESLAGILQWATTERDDPPGCLFATMRSATSRLGPATAARVAARREEMRTVYGDWYRRARERGEVNADVAPELAGRYIDTQLRSVLVQMAAGEPPGWVRAQAHLAFQVLTMA
ncbi:MAG: TetR/AcrR family transcriptional regulator [Bacteroidota bacterium]